MKLKEYIQNVDFDQIWLDLIEYYPDQEKSKEGYLCVWNQLKDLQEVNNCSDITIEIEYINEGEDSYYSISGKKENDTLSYALEYTSWNKWLGMSISDKILTYRKEFSLAHILYEMTWAGFDNDDNNIRKYWDIIKFSMQSEKIGYPPDGLVGKKLRRWKKKQKLVKHRMKKLRCGKSSLVNICGDDAHERIKELIKD